MNILWWFPLRLARMIDFPTESKNIAQTTNCDFIGSCSAHAPQTLFKLFINEGTSTRNCSKAWVLSNTSVQLTSPKKISIRSSRSPQQSHRSPKWQRKLEKLPVYLARTQVAPPSQRLESLFGFLRVFIWIKQESSSRNYKGEQQPNKFCIIKFQSVLSGTGRAIIYRFFAKPLIFYSWRRKLASEKLISKITSRRIYLWVGLSDLNLIEKVRQFVVGVSTVPTAPQKYFHFQLPLLRLKSRQLPIWIILYKLKRKISRFSLPVRLQTGSLITLLLLSIPQT